MIPAGVTSGVGTLTWLTFVPFAIVFGVVSERTGIDRDGWLFVGLGGAAVLLMMVVLPKAPLPLSKASIVLGAPVVPEPVFPADRFSSTGRSAVTRSLGRSARRVERARPAHGGRRDMEVARAAIAEMPASLRQVIVLRDVEGRSAEEVSGSLSLDPDEERDLLHRARGVVRARLELHLERNRERR